MTEENKKVDEFILFPEAKIDDIVLRPWTFGKLLDVNPYIEELFNRLDAKGVILDSLIGIKEMKEIYFAAAPQLLKILEITTGKSEAELKEMDLGKILKIVYVIWTQNSDNVKNALSLFGLKVANPSETNELLSDENKTQLKLD